jgi:hypothetical protein
MNKVIINGVTVSIAVFGVWLFEKKIFKTQLQNVTTSSSSFFIYSVYSSWIRTVTVRVEIQSYKLCTNSEIFVTSE